VRVKLSGDPGLQFKIFSHADGADAETAIFACANPCRVMLLPGEYRVEVSGDPQHVDGERTIQVKKDSTFDFSLPARSAKTAGLALGIAGTALIPAGLYVAFLADSAASCYDSCDHGRQQDPRLPPGVYVGLGMMAVGAVLTPVGWVIFAKNRRPRFEERALVGTRKELRTPPLGIVAVPVPGGATVGLSGRF